MICDLAVYAQPRVRLSVRLKARTTITGTAIAIFAIAIFAIAIFAIAIFAIANMPSAARVVRRVVQTEKRDCYVGGSICAKTAPEIVRVVSGRSICCGCLSYNKSCYNSDACETSKTLNLYEHCNYYFFMRF